MAGHEGGLQEMLSRGIKVAVALGVLSIVEYIIAVNVNNPLLLLLPFVLAKGWLILDYFMHFRTFLAERGI